MRLFKRTSLPCTLEKVSQTNMNKLFKGSLMYGDVIGRPGPTPAFLVCVRTRIIRVWYISA